MKLVSTKLCILVVSTGLLLAGCTKKPDRPAPSSTILGQQPGGSSLNSGLNPIDINAAPDTSLMPRLPDGAIDDGNTIRGLLQPVYFDFDKSSITEKERPKLQAAKDYLAQNPGTRILVEGHCDWRGTAEYNLGLGDRRANAAKRYLMSLGVAADRIESNSKGSLESSRNGDDASMAKDRRAEVVVIKAKGSQPAPGGF